MPYNFRAVCRPLLALLFSCLIGAVCGQSLANDSTAGLSFTRSTTVPLNAVMLFDRAMEAWTWTFGKEPGGKLLRNDRAAGVIEGTARVNFRSGMLSNREETMGTIQYRVIINITTGECRVMISELEHTGNRSSPSGGIHAGPLVRSAVPPHRVRGMGRSSSMKLYAEVKEVATARINSLMQAFDARLRAGAAP